MIFELTNSQREYFGLDPIKSDWDKVILKGDFYRPESTLYFDQNTIRRHIVSTEHQYKETQYDEQTKDRRLLLPKTQKGKEQKLTASMLESRKPHGVYCFIDSYGEILIGNHTTQKTFYSSRWDYPASKVTKDITRSVDEFIQESPGPHLKEIGDFKNAKRKNVKFRSGDIFAFKISRTEFGFGKVLLNIDKIRKQNLISTNHGLRLLMGPPVLVKIYAHYSTTKNIDLAKLDEAPSLPSDYMMDNLLFYGEYEIIGHTTMKEEEFEFPMSYGRCLDNKIPNTFLQWGLIHVEKSLKAFDKYLTGENPLVPADSPSRRVQNPYGYYSIGFRPKYNGIDIKDAVENGGLLNYEKHLDFKAEFDLRNPKNLSVREDIMKAFGLRPNKNYDENRELTKTSRTVDLLAKLKED